MNIPQATSFRGATVITANSVEEAAKAAKYRRKSRFRRRPAPTAEAEEEASRRRSSEFTAELNRVSQFRDQVPSFLGAKEISTDSVMDQRNTSGRIRNLGCRREIFDRSSGFRLYSVFLIFVCGVRNGMYMLKRSRGGT